MDGPEDVWFDRDGKLYTACRDGWIKRMHKNGSWESWRKIDSSGLLGITIAKDGSLVVCDAIQVGNKLSTNCKTNSRTFNDEELYVIECKNF